MNTSNVTTETSAYFAFCQRRYDRAMTKADLMDALADIAMSNGECEVADVLRDGARKHRQKVLEAAETVSDIMRRAAAE